MSVLPIEDGAARYRKDDAAELAGYPEALRLQPCRDRVADGAR
jgi:hypothetical protein